MSYSSIVPCTAVVRVQARLIIFTTCCTFTVYTTKSSSKTSSATPVKTKKSTASNSVIHKMLQSGNTSVDTMTQCVNTT